MTIEDLAASLMEDARKNDGIVALEAEAAVQLELHKAKNERIQHLEARLDVAKGLLDILACEEDECYCNEDCIPMCAHHCARQWLAESDDD